MESKTKEKKKSKAQIEAEFPIIRPEECPGKLMEWISKRDQTNFELWLQMLRTELIPVRRFMRIASENRIWLIGLTVVVVPSVIILWIHISRIT